MDNPHLCVGRAILGTIWFIIANHIVNEAIKIYNVTPDNACALQKVFLRPGDYTIEYD